MARGKSDPTDPGTPRPEAEDTMPSPDDSQALPDAGGDGIEGAPGPRPEPATEPEPEPAPEAGPVPVEEAREADDPAVHEEEEAGRSFAARALVALLLLIA